MPAQRQRALVWQGLADVFKKNGIQGAPAREPIDLPQSAQDSTPLRLNPGCNKIPKPGLVNVDIQPFLGVDRVADLEKPWLWKDGNLDDIVWLLRHGKAKWTDVTARGAACWNIPRIRAAQFDEETRSKRVVA